MLKHKFKISCWDDCNDLSHIKFLIKYSSILSNFATEEDFENVSIVGIKDIDDDIWHPQFYISMNDTDENFFNIYSFGFDISTRMDFLRLDEHFIEFNKTMKWLQKGWFKMKVKIDAENRKKYKSPYIIDLYMCF